MRQEERRLNSVSKDLDGCPVDFFPRELLKQNCHLSIPHGLNARLPKRLLVNSTPYFIYSSENLRDEECQE